ncbi:hypothetical protein GCM10010277_63140 [Streptomyces longisporoflavus]|uniref:hypothetical protein n=1 Tax=Streptomyces longisporoflavus TaxID=28044 RepID=UPI00167D8FFF|nr:hypothetical protein [Streptomyces longisporoflavus]GGV59512.1 hypothetical protein GCM10010277_63140 [Streptomyces longisporoflavus]
MAAEWDWTSGEGLLGMDDPAEWDAAYERGESGLGTAAIGLAFHCSLEEASPRILRAMRLADRGQRGFAYTAAGTAARLNGELTPELYAALRAEGHGGFAQSAVDDTLDYVPFRKLPLWFKWRALASKAEDKLKTWRLHVTYAAEDTRKALRRRRS